MPGRVHWIDRDFVLGWVRDLISRSEGLGIHLFSGAVPSACVRDFILVKRYKITEKLIACVKSYCDLYVWTARTCSIRHENETQKPAELVPRIQGRFSICAKLNISGFDAGDQWIQV